MSELRVVNRFGVVSSQEQAGMTGLEFVRGLASGNLPLNPMAQVLGYDIVEAEAGRLVIAAEPATEHLNPAGVHGGLAATLLDRCMGLAVHSTVRAPADGRAHPDEVRRTA